MSAKSAAPLISTWNPDNDLIGHGVIPVVLAVSDSINGSSENGKSATVASNSSSGSFFNQYQSFAGSVGLTSVDFLSSDAGGAGSLFLLTSVDPSDTTGTIVNLGSLALDSNTGVLTFGAATPVPVPAAVWLFGSALGALVGLGRRGWRRC